MVIFSFKTAWNLIRSQSNPVEWSNLVWHKQKVPKHTFRLWLPRQSSQMKDQGNRDQLPLHYCMGSLISCHHKWAGFEQADKNQFSFQGLSSISRPSISGCKPSIYLEWCSYHTSLESKPDLGRVTFFHSPYKDLPDYRLSIVIFLSPFHSLPPFFYFFSSSSSRLLNPAPCPFCFRYFGFQGAPKLREVTSNSFTWYDCFHPITLGVSPV